MSNEGTRFAKSKPFRLDDNIVTGELPDSLRGAADALGIEEAPVLFAARSDLDLAGSEGTVWLVVCERQAFAVQITAQGAFRNVSGPFTLAEADKVRAFTTVGSAFLQLRINGLYVDVIRYSNAQRELFGRVLQQLER